MYTIINNLYIKEDIYVTWPHTTNEIINKII